MANPGWLANRLPLDYLLSSQRFFCYTYISLIGGGAYLIQQYIGRRDETSEIIVLPKITVAGGVSQPSVVVSEGQINSLCLYPNRILFESIVNPQGQPWKCLNDNKAYFVHIWDKEKEILSPFILPDQRYYDPGVFATRVLELPAHRRIFRRKQTLLQQLTPALVIAAIVVFGVIMVMTLGD